MIPRTLEKTLHRAARKFPIVAVTGPRQSGKTTLVRKVFPNFQYASLETPDQRAFALEDPRGFLQQFRGPVILDEIQRTPELFSYLQGRVDEKKKNGQYILSGSQNFLLLQGVSQSLAGRCALLHLHPFSLHELNGGQDLSLAALRRGRLQVGQPPTTDLWKTLFAGFYPRLHDQRIPPHTWLANYAQTYLERDVRNILQIGDLETFSRFIRLCAGRNGQLLNLSSLASDCGVSHTSIKRWLSILEASFLVVLLRPYHRNFGKRLVKTPKLYFLDTGLLCFLLHIRRAQELVQHAARGAVFESFVLSEIIKAFANAGQTPAVYFWRDSHGQEVDLLIDFGETLLPLEIKSGQTVAGDFFDSLSAWQTLAGKNTSGAALIYGGEQQFERHNTAVYPWFAL